MFQIKIFLAALLTRALGATPTLQSEVEHIVVFMQENRAFDHYYGTLKGVRGYNDRTAPLLPSGLSPFYQPSSTTAGSHSLLCGCVSNQGQMGCSLSFNSAGADLQGILLGPTCAVLQDVLRGANPVPIHVPDGVSCQVLVDQIYNSSIEGLNVSNYFSKPPTCPSGLVANTKRLDKPSKHDKHVTNHTDRYTLPFPLMFKNTSATCMGAPEMAYESNMNILNGGRGDAWNTARAPGYGMSYFNRTDLPYYYTLADTFTIGDQYFQSTFTATCPNREMLFSGSNGLSVSGWLNPNKYCALDDWEPSDPGFAWETMGETLEQANVTWKLYQGNDNFDDNGFAWFSNYQHAQPGNPLYDKGMHSVNSTSYYGFVEAFENDVEAGTLPQVSWLVGPAKLSEHAANHPQDGEDLSRRFIDILQRHPETYKKTVFILNYDEGGQFYDHVVPPLPPTNASMHGGGQSTVTTKGELIEQEAFNIPIGHPIGLGWRVPLMLISPWSRGGYVYSEVADHTSVIQFIEQRFNVQCPNISPWRRAVTSDLTSAFDFSHPDYSWPLHFPDTYNNLNSSAHQCLHNPPPEVPKLQRPATQEPGTKKQRAIPSYVFDVTDHVAQSTVTLTMAHRGGTVGDARVTAVSFGVYDRAGVHVVGKAGNVTSKPPRFFTVESGRVVTSRPFPIDADEGYELHLHGPNGFVRIFRGDVSRDNQHAAQLMYKPDTQEVVVQVTSSKASKKDVSFHVVDMAYGNPLRTMVVGKGGQVQTITLDLSSSGNWYDLVVTSADKYGKNGKNNLSHEEIVEATTTASFYRRFMGRMETGKDSITDPAMAAGKPALGHEDKDVERNRVHPPMPENLVEMGTRKWSEVFLEQECKSARSKTKDLCKGVAGYDPHVPSPWQHSEL